MDFKKVLLATALVTNVAFAADDQQAAVTSATSSTTVVVADAEQPKTAEQLAAAAKAEMDAKLAKIVAVTPTDALKSAHDATLRAFIALPVRAGLATPEQVSKKDSDKSLALQAARVMRELAAHARDLRARLAELEGKIVMTQEELNARVADANKDKIVMTQEELNAHVADATKDKLVMTQEELNAHVAAATEGKIVMTEEELDARVTAALLEQA